jgi:serine/threonine-protein kinase
MHWMRYDPAGARRARQREEAETALRLAPDLPQAHVAMARAHFQGRRDFRQALDEFMIALKGLPNDSDLWFWIGATHRRLGHWNEVFAALERAVQLDPRSANVFYALGGPTNVLMRRYADAVRAYDQALSLAPDFHDAAIQRGWTYVRWQGRLDTLREVLDRIPGNADVAFSGSVAAQRAALLFYERNADGLLREVQAATGDHWEAENFFLPGALYAGWAHHLRGNHAAARAAFEAAEARLDTATKESPDDWRIHASRGLTLAWLGRRDEALLEARWLQQSIIFREDAFAGPRVAEARAQILGQAGNADTALDEIERLLAGPSFLTVHTLRLDPRWDPIRDHPRFKGLLAKHGAATAG